MWCEPDYGLLDPCESNHALHNKPPSYWPIPDSGTVRTDTVSLNHNATLSFGKNLLANMRKNKILRCVHDVLIQQDPASIHEPLLNRHSVVPNRTFFLLGTSENEVIVIRVGI